VRVQKMPHTAVPRRWCACQPA